MRMFARPYRTNAGSFYYVTRQYARTGIGEVKTIFAYETFQETVYHLLFARDMLCIAYLGAIFRQLKFISSLRRAKDARQ